MRKIAVFTGSRAEYGLLSGLMRLIADDAELDLSVIAGAMHLAPEFGETWRQIEADGFAIAARVDMLVASDSRVGVAKSLGLGTIGMADALDRLRPDCLVLLGDRFETLAAAQAALILGIPLCHIHGGEITEGAYDDAMRHAITKMAALHFVAAEPFRRRVIQMGTPPSRVFTVGAPGLDAVLGKPARPLSEVAADLGIPLRAPYFLATYHPVTAADEDALAGCKAMLEALASFADHQVILTYPNADHGGRALIGVIEAFVQGRDNFFVVPSLGISRYQTVLAAADAMVGNSSSGIIEAPGFGVPTVNIGDRQKGRLAAGSVRHVPPTRAAILDGLDWAVSDEGRALAKSVTNPYGTGKAAETIHAILRHVPFPKDLPFCDSGDAS
jgi:UDP-N-acetylglucosamine 2-epimerase (non-hydrolysing)